MVKKPIHGQAFRTCVFFSERAQQLTSSAIREILKVTERPEVISFAGGLPAPGGFPVEVVRAAFDKVLSTNGRAALQYGPTEGYAPLRKWVAEDLTRAGADVSPDQVLIVSGSQQALDLLGKVPDRQGQQDPGRRPQLPGRAAIVQPVPAWARAGAHR